MCSRSAKLALRVFPLSSQKRSPFQCYWITLALCFTTRRAGSFHPSTKQRSNHMFTRVVELKSKSGKSKELSNTVNEKVLPILKKQRGFVDEIVLVSDAESDRVLGISFWDTKEDAELYHREQFPKIQDSVRHLLEGEPVVRTFNVHAHAGQKIAAEKAA